MTKNKTSKQRSEIAKRAWVTIRANKAKRDKEQKRLKAKRRNAALKAWKTIRAKAK